MRYYIKDIERKFLGHIGNDIDMPIADKMHIAFQVAESSGAQGDFFHQAAFAGNVDYIADPDLIFHEDKETADNILN